MLQPKKLKFTKQFNRVPKGVASKGTTVVFGEFGLRAMGNGYITSRQIEAARMAITRYVKRKGKVWIRIFPDMPITRKPSVRMGGGRSPVEYYVAVVKRGRILFEIGGVDKEVAINALHLAMHKLSLKVKVVSKKQSE